MELDLEARPVSTTNIRSPPTAYIQPLNDDNGLRYRGTPTAESDEHSIERHVHVPRNITSNAVQSGNTLRIDPTASFYDNLRKGITDSGANHCIFICGSSGRSSRIVPVPVKNRNNDVATWEQIREHWYETTGLWKKYIPFYGVSKVSEAKVSVGLNFPLKI
ncbi:hypothetical protein DPV78_008078 [Talaromyces pinophilus]|nr:hypothetical protein DPV78_008078 [Talaromyces pinophilus]